MTPFWIRGLLDLIAPRSCPGCDSMLRAGADSFCTICEEQLEPSLSEDSAYRYQGPIVVALGRLKYQRKLEHLDILAGALADSSVPFTGLVERVIPIPLHPNRLRARGWNQSALLAREVARRLGVPLDVDTLWRARDTRPQAGLDASDRALNVRACFRARRLAGRVLLIDDVKTTGSTLAQASEALRSAGAQEVFVLTLAVADRMDTDAQ